MCLHIPCCCCCYYLFFLQWDLPLPAAVAPLPLFPTIPLFLSFSDFHCTDAGHDIDMQYFAPASACVHACVCACACARAPVWVSFLHLILF